MIGTHFVYHNWHLKKAILHHGSCPSCNYGEGIHQNKTDENSEWVSFASRESAQVFVDGKKGEKYRETGVCGTCSGDLFEADGDYESSHVSRPKGRRKIN